MALRQSKQPKTLWISISMCSWKNIGTEVESMFVCLFFLIKDWFIFMEFEGRGHFSFLPLTQDVVLQKKDFRCPTSGTSVTAVESKSKTSLLFQCLSICGDTKIHRKSSFYPSKIIQNYNALSDTTGTRHNRPGNVCPQNDESWGFMPFSYLSGGGNRQCVTKTYRTST